MFVGDRQRLSLIMELSIHCHTALVLKVGCKFGYLIETKTATVYNTTFFLSLGSSLQILAQYFAIFFRQPMNRFVVMLQTHNIGWGID